VAGLAGQAPPFRLIPRQAGVCDLDPWYRLPNSTAFQRKADVRCAGARRFPFFGGADGHGHRAGPGRVLLAQLQSDSNTHVWHSYNARRCKVRSTR